MNGYKSNSCFTVEKKLFVVFLNFEKFDNFGKTDILNYPFLLQMNAYYLLV